MSQAAFAPQRQKRWPTMRLLPVAILIGCTSAPTPAPALSELAHELSTLPDSSAVMARASRIEQAGMIDRDISEIHFTPAVPTVMGAVVEVWRDRLAVSMDDESPLPTEGSLMAVHDRAGIKADAYVVRVRGRVAFTQFRLLGSCTTPVVGDRVAGEHR